MLFPVPYAAQQYIFRLMATDGGRDSLSVEVWRQRVERERRYLGVSPTSPSTELPTNWRPLKLGASKVTIYDTVYAATPRGTLLSGSQTSSPRQLPGLAADPTDVPYDQTSYFRRHMQNHLGGGTLPLNGGTQGFSSPRILGRSFGQLAATIGNQESYNKASQQSGARSKDVSLSDTPRSASRKPSIHPSIKPHESQFLSWPGCGLYVPRGKHHYKPQVDSRNEARGELPPTTQLLISAGSRPGFPTFSLAGLKK